MMNTDVKSPIGFYDSGVGGITVLDSAMAVLPKENYIYLADCSYAPYGGRPREEIVGRAHLCVGKLVDAGVKAVVVACNTATAVAIDSLRDRFGGILIGAEPAIKPACEQNAYKNILVLVTPLTAGEPRLKKLIACHPDKNITVAPLEGLAADVERNIDNVERLRPRIYRALSDYPPADAVVLGCTHYVHVKSIVAEFYAGRAAIFDGNKGIANRLYSELNRTGRINTGGGYVQFVSV